MMVLCLTQVEIMPQLATTAMANAMLPMRGYVMLLVVISRLQVTLSCLSQALSTSCVKSSPRKTR